MIFHKKNKPTKDLTILKSSVVAMGVVLIVLLLALLFVPQIAKKQVSCPDNEMTAEIINVEGGIEKMEWQNNEVLILTKPNPKSNTQQIIKMDVNCSRLISATTLQISN